MSDKKGVGVVAIYNEFIKDNPDENVFITRHPREEEDLMVLVTTKTVFMQLFPAPESEFEAKGAKAIASHSDKAVKGKNK